MGRGQPKRQNAIHLPDQGARHNGQPLFADDVAPAQGHAELQIKQFVEHHGPMRRRDSLIECGNLNIERGKMQLPQGLIERHQVQALTNFLRHAVGDLIDMQANGTMHDPPHGSHRHFRGLVINGQDAGGLILFFHRLHVRVDHPLAALHALLDLPVQEDTLTKLIALLKIAMLVIPQQKEEAGFVAHNRFQHPTTPAGQKATAHTGDLSGYRGLISNLKITDLLDLAPVLIAKRNMVQQVFDRLDTQPGQLLRATRAYAFDILYRFFERRLGGAKRARRRGRGGSIPSLSPLGKGGWGGGLVKELGSSL